MTIYCFVIHLTCYLKFKSLIFWFMDMAYNQKDSKRNHNMHLILSASPSTLPPPAKILFNVTYLNNSVLTLVVIAF